MSMLVEKPGPEILCLSSFVMEKSQIKKIVHYSTILIVKILAKFKPDLGFVLNWLDAIQLNLLYSTLTLYYY